MDFVAEIKSKVDDVLVRLKILEARGTLIESRLNAGIRIALQCVK